MLPERELRQAETHARCWAQDQRGGKGHVQPLDPVIPIDPLGPWKLWVGGWGAQLGPPSQMRPQSIEMRRALKVPAGRRRKPQVRWERMARQRRPAREASREWARSTWPSGKAFKRRR